jgi:uncharacterized protein
LVGALIALVAAILAVAAVGGVLLFERTEPSTAIPPQTSTIAPRPTTVPPRTSAPPTTRAPTIEPPTMTTRSPTPRPSPRPTTTTKPPTTSEGVLVRNPLYGQRISPSDCAQRPRPLPISRRGEERFLKRMMGCLAEAYAGPLEAAGFTLTTPPVVIYTGTVQTPCGQGLKGYPVFYCSANQTIYSSAGSIADYGQGLRLGGYWIAFHEYGHHVQRRIGVLAAAYSRDEEQLQISRRIELQADCMMAMTGISIRTTGIKPADRQELRRWRRAAADQIHGKTASQLYWIERGFGTDDFGTCSTWRATKHIG